MQPAKSSESPALWKLLAWLAAVLAGAALLAPGLFWGGQWLLGHIQEGAGPLGWLRAEIAKADFSRYFNRAVLLVALALLWPLIRWAGFDRGLFPRWQPVNTGLAQLGVGFGFASVFLLALGAVFCVAGVYHVRPGAPWLGFAGPLFTALCVAAVEEFFFRGALLGLLLRSMGALAAVFWGTFIFAIVHFLKPPEGVQIPPGEVSWLSGFRVIGDIFGNFGHVDFLLAEFCTLFVVGWVLAQGRLVTGRLWVSIGMHAGWVFGLKYFAALTRGSKALRGGELLPWIGENLKIGLLPLVVVSITGWIVLRLVRKQGNASRAPVSSA